MQSFSYLPSAFRIGADLAHVRGRVQEKRAGEVHRRLDALVEDPDLRPVADPDDVPLDDDLVARAELQDLGRIGDGEGDFVRGHHASLSYVTDTVRGDVGRGAARGPALVVHGDRVERHVRVGVLDVDGEDGDVAAQSHRADAGLVQQVVQILLELGHERIGVVRSDRPRDRLLREVHRVVGRAADPDPDDPRRARLPAGADDRVEHELLDPAHAVGGHAHLQEAHVLGARALRHALHVEAVPVGHEVPVDDRDAVADVLARVLARQRVNGVRAERMLDGRALCPLSERFVDPGRMQGKVLADAAVVDRDAGVLAHEVLLLLGDVDVAEDRLQDALARDRGLPLRRVRERVAEVLRDVLQRPDVEMRCRVANGAVEVGRRRRRSRSRPLRRRAPGAPAEDRALEQ